MPIPPTLLSGLLLTGDRRERLLQLLRIYRVDRVALHSLVYLLENMYGVELGYRECSWKLYATGPYCSELEEDLRLLTAKGLVRVSEDGTVETLDTHSPQRVSVDGGRIVREAWKLLAFKR